MEADVSDAITKKLFFASGHCFRDTVCLQCWLAKHPTRDLENGHAIDCWMGPVWTNSSPDQIWLPPLVRKQEDYNFIVVARSDQLWQLQIWGTTYGSQNWSRTISGCHNWSPRTIGGWDQFARDRSLNFVL